MSKDLTEVNVKNGSRRGGFVIDQLWLAAADVLAKVDLMYARSPNQEGNVIFDKWRDVQQMQLSIITQGGTDIIFPKDYGGFPSFERAVIAATKDIGESEDAIVVLHHINVFEPVALAQMAIVDDDDVSFFK